MPNNVAQGLKRGLHTFLRQYSTPGTSKKYTDTLLLPKTSFPLRGDPSVRESLFRERMSEKLYKWQWENAKGPLFILHDGPPYANGNLHMGHALNKILKDIINRFHVLLGYRVNYVPGWDCHGLPIENKALMESKATHNSLPAVQIRTLARKTANREIAVQKAEFRKLGIMADWASGKGTYSTMDHDYEIRQLGVFKTLVEKNLIYRRYRPVYYSPVSCSALAEAELVYTDDHVSQSAYVAFECKLNAMSEHFQETIKPHSSDLKVNLLVWTTTPWTLPTNMGVAVHSDLEYSVVKIHQTGELFVVGYDRLPSLYHVLGDTTVLYILKGSDLLYSSYSGIFQQLGGHSELLPILHAVHVTSTSGTGLVHCAPAHGIEDYQAFMAHGLLSSPLEKSSSRREELRCLVDAEGKFSEEYIASASWLPESVGARLTGKRVLVEGCTEVIKILDELGNLVMEEKIKHRYPYDWKTNTPVIVTATSQWFADLTQIKEDALKVLQSVQFFPDAGRTRLASFIKGRSEWCISRQRPWGVPIPALYNDSTGEAVLSSESLEHIIQVLDRKGIEHWWQGPVDDFLSPAFLKEHGTTNWMKGNDTMDVWFDSGTSWTGIFDSLPREDESGRVVADVCLEGSDQHRGWFQSLLLTAIGVSSKTEGCSPVNIHHDHSSEIALIKPYNTVVTHGFVLDDEGKKMSKSLGNVISPMSLVEGGKDTKREPAHGADVLRLWAATVDHNRDTMIGPVVIQNIVESLRKIRNSARFLLGNLPHSRDCPLNADVGHMSLTDRYMMFQLYQFEKAAKESYATYQFSQVATALDRFAKVTLSSFYLDVSKDSLYADSPDSSQRKSVIWVMNEVLHTMKIIMAPILPHLAEEIHAASNGSTGYSSDENHSSVFMEGWKSVEDQWNEPSIEHDMKQLLTVRGLVTGLLEKARTDKLIKSSLEASVDVIIPGDLVPTNESRLLKLLYEQESHLRRLFIVSDVLILDEGSLGVDGPEWSYSKTMELEDKDELINIRVRPSAGLKCPRCWTYTRTAERDLCDRCTEVLC